MARGRPRKPIAQLKLAGTYRRDRHGDDGTQWEPTGEPQRPESLTGDAADMWERIVVPLVRSGVATQVDEPALIALVSWWQRYCNASAALDALNYSNDPRVWRLQILTANAWKCFASISSSFGLNPSDRAKLRLPTDSPKSKLAAFVAAKHA